jgi:Leucine-rich repeat (LRR) protein
MENLAGPRLLQAFFDHATEAALAVLDDPSKAALRLSCTKVKAIVDGTVTTAKGHAITLETVLRCGWQLSELQIKPDYQRDADLTSLLCSVCWKLPMLQVLEINSPPALEDLPFNIGQLSKLRTLKAINSLLTSLPASFRRLSSLDRLEIYETNRLDATSRPWRVEGLVPLKQLTQLKYLKLGKSLVSKPFFSGWLGSCHFPLLQDLTLFGDMPPSISNFTSLTALDVSQEASEVTWSIASLELLKKCVLQRPDGIINLPTSFTKLTALEQLEVGTDLQSFALLEHFHKLTDLKFEHVFYGSVNVPYPEFLWTFTSLKKLDLEGSSGPTLPDALGNLKNLEWLCLRWHENVEVLPETIGHLTLLTGLVIDDFPELLKLPEWVGNLNNLRELEISGCSQLTTLPESLGYLQRLEKLNLAQNSYDTRILKFPSSIGKLRALKELVVENWEAGKLFLPETFADLVLDMPVEECSLEKVYFTETLVSGPRVDLALQLLKQRRVLRRH